MPKLGMEPQRRAAVINATLTCISMHGMDGMTLDRVAEYAGCSKGVVTYYYKNKDALTLDAFKAFLSYYGLKIGDEIKQGMSAEAMIDVTLKHLLPPYKHETRSTIQVSQLEGIDKMGIPYDDQAKLFVQFFARAALDPGLQEVVSKSYSADLHGIARIFEYGRASGQMSIEDPHGAAYGLLAMVVGLSFFRVAQVPTLNGEDNRFVCEEYVRRFING
jgi:AcrR family transcriptional regulator